MLLFVGELNETQPQERGEGLLNPLRHKKHERKPSHATTYGMYRGGQGYVDATTPGCPEECFAYPNPCDPSWRAQVTHTNTRWSMHIIPWYVMGYPVDQVTYLGNIHKGPTRSEYYYLYWTCSNRKKT